MDDPDQIAKYFTEYVNRGFRRIFEEQRRIAAAKIYGKQAYRTDGTPRSRSGRLQQALASPTFSITGSGSGISANAQYPTYLRFLDMKRLGNYRIYNRPVWGILYKETFNDIRFEFSAWLRKNLADSIRESYQQS
ncbi:hypothetical protein [Duncaniella muris]|uniref:HK97 gp10 family phage protein n=1 Tax=Duncaniella muris TaxID=2094150 RepID=A0A2V1IM58_9BACT|nr:hypothetical protein [Duncaniella muris]NBH91677.1 hypothetical protein [Muribaculaceae bacterium S4]NBI20089.1 hypothetical protein [Muribaculaceae bacterium Z1]PWB00615.1 hypothetical protein C5O23_12290 [Duncaniella muris]RXE74049.1 hypothetical protein ED551_05445 [Muribaculaceae bacterium Isolate-013 (NCI)]